MTIKTKKEIEQVIAPPPVHMVGDGFRVHGFLPGSTSSWSRTSPFLLLDYLSKYEFPPSKTPKGVGPHPHRGFETVTFIYHGQVAHHDSAGNSGVIGEGDVQWMTAASGILHKEYHGKELTQKGGVLHGAQIWVNLPAKFKMTPPKYQALLHKDMGKHNLDNNAGVIHIIAGNYQGTKGPAQTFTPVHIYDIRLNENAVMEMDFPKNYNTFALVMEGEANFNEKKVPQDHLVLFKNKGEDIAVKAITKSTILLLSGEPINEPIIQYGPFVMNTEEEINKAIQDYNTGKFGVLGN